MNVDNGLGTLMLSPRTIRFRRGSKLVLGAALASPAVLMSDWGVFALALLAALLVAIAQQTLP